MKINVSKRAEMRDFGPETPGWFAKFLDVYNAAITQLAQIAQGSFSLFTNGNCAERDYDLPDGSELIVLSPVPRCRGALPLRAREYLNGHPVAESVVVALGVRLIGENRVGLTAHYPSGLTTARVSVMFVGA